MIHRRHDAERGAATVLVLAMAGLLCFVGVALAGVGGVVRAQRTAQSAADLAALAAAAALTHGDEPCDAAEVVAGANGTTLAECVTRNQDVWVTVEAEDTQWLGRRVAIDAQARAGPGGSGADPG